MDSGFILIRFEFCVAFNMPGHTRGLNIEAKATALALRDVE